jgi:hypothetical protein
MRRGAGENRNGNKKSAATAALSRRKIRLGEGTLSLRRNGYWPVAK